MYKLALSGLGVLCALSVYSQTPFFYFESGFEGTSELTQYVLNGNPNLNNADITGEDNGYDWELDLDDNPNVGSFRIFYEEGDTSRSIASIIPEPGNPSNHVLSYDIKLPHITYSFNGEDTLDKGRIQVGINGNPNWHEFHFRERLYIHPDFVELVDQPLPISWLTIQEFWNNAAASTLPFRVTVNLRKASGTGSDFYLGSHGQTRGTDPGDWDDVWDTVDVTFPLPFGEWFTLETHFVEGDSLTGAFTVTLTDAQNNVHNLIDISDFTHHPNDTAPDGVTNFNPMKLYTSGTLIDYMDSVDACLCLYWDDFTLWTDTTTVTDLTEAQNNDGWSYYPNPVSSTLTFNSSRKLESVEVFNLLGERLVTTSNLTSGSLDLSMLPSGIYFARFVFVDQKERTIKLVKK